MLNKVIECLRHSATAIWAYGQGDGVSRGFWALVLLSAFTAIGSQVGLAFALAVWDLFDVPLSPWASFLTWPPLLAAGLFGLAFEFKRRSHRLKIARADFFEGNHESPLSLAAFKHINRPGPWPGMLIATMAVAFGLFDVWAVLFASQPNGEFVTAIIVLFMIIFLCLVAPSATILYLMHSASLTRNTPAALVGMFSRFSVRSRFERLPEGEKAIMVDRAVKMGFDSTSKSMMRGAVSEYQARIKRARAESAGLTRNTPVSSLATSRAEPPRRF